MAINITRLANEINRQLAMYTGAVEEDVKAAAKRTAMEGAAKLKTVGPTRTGDYRDGWVAELKNGKWIVWNPTRYRLTHLLEKGHAKIGGGRVAARPHIKPVELQLIRDFEQRVREAAQG